MTSRPVQNERSLINLFKTGEISGNGSISRAGGFGDVMSKASGNERNLADTRSKDVINRINSAADKKTSGTDNRDKSWKQKEVSQAKQAGDIAGSRAEALDDSVNAVEEAGNQLVKEIADKMGMSEEDVLEAMELLGFTGISLLDVQNVTQLVLTLSGEMDSMTLLTDENLYGTLQDILQTVDDVKNGLMEEMQVTPQELEQTLDELKQQTEQIKGQEPEIPDLPKEETPEYLPESEAKAPEEANKETIQTTEKISITVEENGKTVELSADEKGSIQEVKDVVTQEVKTDADTDSSGQEAKQGQGDTKGRNQGEGSFQTGNPLLDTLLQNKVQMADAAFEQTAVFVSPETKEIMNQILDYMKIQLKPDMDYLEMQLHPENLGTLQIQITSKGGEVTAQFKVQNETVKAAIESQIVDLKENLKEQGVRVEAVEVTVESHSFESNLWQGQGQEDNSGQNQKKGTRRININELNALFEEDMSEEDALAAQMMEANGNTVDYTV